MKAILYAILVNLAVMSAAVAAPPATWVLIGDSIMSAVWPTTLNGPYGAPSQMVDNLLEVERNISIRNISSPGSSLGATVPNGFNGIVPGLSAIHGPLGNVKGYIIQAGTNDFGLGMAPNVTASSLRAIMAYARKTNRKVLLMDLTYRSNQNVKNKVGHTLDSYRWVRGVVCNEYKDVCKFASRDNTAFAVATPSYYDPHEVNVNFMLHLNAAGLRAYADWVKAAAAQHGYF